MEQNTEEKLKILHAQMLVLLKKFHAYCMANRIHYSIHGGTLLGAVREGGFIPWDDDIDITMTRKQYNRFRRIVNKKGLTDGMSLGTHGPIPKVIMPCGDDTFVWIDIFIWDYVTENPILRKIKILGIEFFQVFIRTPADLKKTRENGKYQGASFFLMAAVTYFGVLFPYKWKKAWMDRFFMAFPGERKSIHRANDQLCGIGLILPAEITDKYVMLPFEDTELSAFARWHEILVSIYDENYMTPKRYTDELLHEESRHHIENYLD